MAGKPDRPDWDLLYEVASGLDGHFTTAQAAAAGYSPQLLAKHLRAGRIQRIRRGVYRLVHYPAGEHEDLVVLWLWSESEGLFSHETALALHGLSDVLPTMVHMTLPRSWTRRRLRVPHGLAIHHADVPADDRAWFGSVPVTAPARTLRDCAAENLSPELIREALDEGLDRGLYTRSDVRAAVESLRKFDGAER